MIITADEARRMGNRYIPYEIESAIEYVMKIIENYAKSGRREIKFNDYCTPKYYWNMIITEEFEKFIKNCGYKYSINNENRYSSHGEVVVEW